MTHYYWPGPSGVATLALALGPDIELSSLSPKPLNAGVVDMLILLSFVAFDGEDFWMAFLMRFVLRWLGVLRSWFGVGEVYRWA
jgi:uncharacterized protein (DUF934 family)